jgi:hypothetical protein
MSKILYILLRGMRLIVFMALSTPKDNQFIPILQFFCPTLDNYFTISYRFNSIKIGVKYYPRKKLIQFISYDNQIKQKIQLKDTLERQVFKIFTCAGVSTTFISEMSIKEQNGTIHAWGR